jgi:hypothetical protein
MSNYDSYDIHDLIARVEASAEWRAQKAKQYANDRRNAQSSQALAKLGQNLKALPADDENIIAYEAVMDRLEKLDEGRNFAYRVSVHQTEYISRYGFTYPADGDPADFLSALTEEYQEWVDEAEEEVAEEEREAAYEEAAEIADEAAKEAADEIAKEAAEEAAKEAAEEAYKETYDEVYKEAYDEAYKEALTDALRESGHLS